MIAPAFGALAEQKSPSWDASWYLAMTRFAEHTPWLNEPVRLLSDYGIILIALAMVATFLWARDRPSQGMAATLWLPVAVVVGYVVNSVIKNLVTELRPCRVLPDVTTVSPCDPPTDYAFPSNHSVVVGAFAVALFLLNRRWGLLAALFALLMGASRVYVGAHYPHDVLVGLLVGALVGACGILLNRTLTVLVTRMRLTAPGAALLGADPAQQGPRHRHSSMVDSGGTRTG
jgi:membrane-associated phospholipid phosphatase